MIDGDASPADLPLRHDGRRDGGRRRHLLGDARPIAVDSSPMLVSGLDAVTWQSPRSRWRAMVPAGVAAGAYDVVVTDPRGRRGTLPQAFTSLGPDLEAPTITILTPEPPRHRRRGDDGLDSPCRPTTATGFVDARWTVTVSTDAEPTATPIPATVGAPHRTETCQLDFPAPMPEPAAEIDMLRSSSRRRRHRREQPPRRRRCLRLVPRPLADRPVRRGWPHGRRHRDRRAGHRTSSADRQASPGGTELLIDGVSIAGRPSADGDPGADACPTTRDRDGRGHHGRRAQPGRVVRIRRSPPTCTM